MVVSAPCQNPPTKDGGFCPSEREVATSSLVQKETQGKTFQVSVRLWLIAGAVVSNILTIVYEGLLAPRGNAAVRAPGEMTEWLLQLVAATALRHCTRLHSALYVGDAATAKGQRVNA